jgi:hypothetical protein
VIDQILAKASRLAGAGGILFMGPGYGGPGSAVLLVHPKDSSTWELPSSMDVAAGLDLDEPIEVAGTTVSRVGAQFTPKLTAKHDDHMWISPAFALTCTATHPSAANAIKSIAGRGNTHGELKMESRADFMAAQQKADRTYNIFGDSAPASMQGETLCEYQARLASPFQKWSGDLKDAKLARIGCPRTLEVLVGKVYADAAAALYSGRTAERGKLVSITKNDASGRPITKYVGDIGGFMDQFLRLPILGSVRALAALANGHR